ncbi:MAG: PAS domain S-box protein [Desulfobaccales bacterium]
MMKGEDLDHHLNALEQRFQALQDQAGGWPEAREALAPVLQAVAQAIAELRTAQEAETCHLKQAPGVQMEHSRQPEAVQGRCETFLHHDFEALPDLLTVIDRDFNIVMSNWPRHDYGTEAERRSYLKCYRIYAHQDSPCEFCQVREVFATGSPYIREWFDPVAGGFREIYAFPILDEAGNVVLVAEHGRDIQERKQVEADLAMREELYRVLTERSLAGVYLIQDHKFRYVNPVLAQMFGYTPDEMIGRMSPRDTTHPDDLPLVDEQIRQRLTGEVEEAHYTFRGLRRDGTVIHLEGLGRRIDYQGRPAIVGTLLDITERTRAEETLRDSEEKYRGLIETTGTGYVIIDPEGKVLDANPEYVRISGHDQLEEIVGRSVIEWTAKGDRDRNAAEVKQCFQNGFVKSLELHYQQKDGRIIPVEINATTINTSEGLKVLSLVRDISERKQAQEALQTQALVLESMGEAVTGISEDGHIVFANPAAYTMFGYPEGELTGQPVTVLNDLPPEESERFAREIIERLQKEGTWTGEVQNRTKDGISFITYARVTTLELPEKKLWISVQEDITAHKHLAKATKKYLQFIELLMETIPNPIFYEDAQGIILGCNKAYAEYAGVAQEEIPGKTVYDLSPGEVARVCDAGAQKALQDPGTKVRLELQMPAADGSQRQMICYKAAFIEASGNGGVVSVLTDITELQRAQEALRESEARYRLLADNVMDVLWIMDTSYSLTYVSPSVKNMTGYTPEEFLSLGLRQIVLPVYHRVFGTSLEKLLAPEMPPSLRYEVEYQRKDSSHGWGEITITLMRDPQGLVKGLTGMARDITLRKRAEDALRESEVKYRELVESANCIILRLDTQGNIRFFNKFAQTFFGFTDEEIIGRNVVGTIVPEVDSSGYDLAAKVRDILKHPEDYYSNENENMRRNGERVWVAWTNKAIYGRDGELNEVLCIGIDRTEQIKAEKALKESEERYRTLFETSPNGIVLMDLQMNITMANQRGLHLFGFSSPEEVLTRNGVDFIAPEDQPYVLPLIQEMFETGESQTVNVKLLTKDGTRVSCLVTASFLRDAAGEPQAIMGVAQDISDLKRAEEAVRESEARLRAIFEHAPVGITMVDHTGRFLQTNPAYQEIVGYSATELQSLIWQQLTLPEDLPGNLEMQEELLAGKRQYYSIEKRYLRKDGEIVWVSAMLSRLQNGLGEARVVGTILDVTARKRAEEALRESEQRFRLMAETIQDVFWIATPGIEKTKYVSPRYEQIWGRPRKELYQSPQSFLEAMHPEDRQRVKSEVFAAHNRGEAFSLEYRIIRLDGEVRWIHDRGFPVKGEQGHVILFTGVATDITERKTLEQQLLLAQKMEAVGRLAGGVAHDFNNLLMAITGYGELMKTKVLKGDPLYGYLEDILKTTDRAAALTGQLLTFSRRQIVCPQMMDLNRVVLDLERMLRRLIEADIEMKIITAPKLGAVQIDPGHLNQIIMNLVINARDAMPCEGRIAVETAEVIFDTSRQTRSGLAQPGSYVVLQVSDTGMGMDEAIQAHIFEPFFTTKEPGRGTGLGLSTVYGIVKQSGGFIDLDSEPGKGSTFKIYLPRLDASTKTRKVKVSKPTQFRGQETVLLVEDEDVLRTLLAKFLRLHGYTVLEARHGGEALLICEQHQGQIHLMVTDVVMPRMSGRVLADRLTPLRPDMKVLYMSGYTEDEVVQRGVAERAVAFLQKPFKPIDLVHQVYTLLKPQTSR